MLCWICLQHFYRTIKLPSAVMILHHWTWDLVGLKRSGTCGFSAEHRYIQIKTGTIRAPYCWWVVEKQIYCWSHLKFWRAFIPSLELCVSAINYTTHCYFHRNAISPRCFFFLNVIRLSKSKRTSTAGLLLECAFQLFRTLLVNDGTFLYGTNNQCPIVLCSCRVLTWIFHCGINRIILWLLLLTTLCTSMTTATAEWHQPR